MKEIKRASLVEKLNIYVRQSLHFYFSLLKNLNKDFWKYKLLIIRCSSIWPWCLFDLLIPFCASLKSVSLIRTDSGPKVDLSGSKNHVLRAKKHMLFRTRVVHFWTRIWSGRNDGYRVGSEQWDDGNTNNGDGGKGRCLDRLLAYSLG